nr:hypothetical protein Q903MT_gene4529 [Picea sitchensis]
MKKIMLCSARRKTGARLAAGSRQKDSTLHSVYLTCGGFEEQMEGSQYWEVDPASDGTRAYMP